MHGTFTWNTFLISDVQKQTLKAPAKGILHTALAWNLEVMSDKFWVMEMHAGMSAYYANVH